MRQTKDPNFDLGRAVVVKSDDGGVCFQLRSTRSGLWVQRDRRRSETRARLVQSVVFSSVEEFLHWCECDPVRFEYPLVFSTVRREGGALLQTHGRATFAGRNNPAT